MSPQRKPGVHIGIDLWTQIEYIRSMTDKLLDIVTPLNEAILALAEKNAALEQRVEMLVEELQNIAGWQSLESVDDAYAMRESAQEALASQEEA